MSDWWEAATRAELTGDRRRSELETPAPEPDPPARRPLVSQGGRSPAAPIGRKPSPDDLLRSGRGQGVWQPVF
jgi:hypothetical protein